MAVYLWPEWELYPSKDNLTRVLYSSGNKVTVWAVLVSAPPIVCFKKQIQWTSCSKCYKFILMEDEFCSTSSLLSPNWSSHRAGWGSLITIVKHQSLHPWIIGKLSFGPLRLIIHAYLCQVNPDKNLCESWQSYSLCSPQEKVQVLSLNCSGWKQPQEAIWSSLLKAGSTEFGPPCVSAAFGYLQHAAGLLVNKAVFLQIVSS